MIGDRHIVRRRAGGCQIHGDVVEIGIVCAALHNGNKLASTVIVAEGLAELLPLRSDSGLERAQGSKGAHVVGVVHHTHFDGCNHQVAYRGLEQRHGDIALVGFAVAIEVETLGTLGVVGGGSVGVVR